MNKLILTALIALSGFSSYGQWDETQSGKVTTTDNVVIRGTNTNGYNLHVDGIQRINSGTESSNLLNINTWISNSIKYKGTMLNFTSATDGSYGHFKFIQANDANGTKFSLNSQGNIYTAGTLGIGGENTNGYNLHVNGKTRINSGTETSDLLNINTWISNSTKYKGTMLNFTSATDGNYGHFKFIQANDATGLKFSLNSQGNIYTAGTLGIGTETTGPHKLAVDGSIGAREIKVEMTQWQDQVFYEDYNLRTLEEVEEHINENGHLPEIPSEAEVTENGINLGEMNAKLLQKIEELTLYMIDVNKRVNQLETENSELKESNQQLKKEVTALKNE